MGGFSERLPDAEAARRVKAAQDAIERSVENGFRLRYFETYDGYVEIDYAQALAEAVAAVRPL